MKWLLMRHGPLVIRPVPDPYMILLGVADAQELHRGPL